jgi:DNA-binding NarL/FixJ family response regulator
MGKIRVLLADDHETVREGIKAILSAQPDLDVVAEAADGDAAIAGTKAFNPDVVIMDISMPAVNGLRATEAIKQSCRHTQILVLTRHADEGYVQQLLQAGASGYVLKQSKPKELLNAVRTIATGAMYLDPALTGTVISRFVRNPSTMPPTPESALTPREEEVLRRVAWGYSNKQIAAELEVSVKTVETHKANSSQKLGLRNRIDIVRYALLRGWLQDR